MFSTLNHCFLLKYSIQNIYLSSEKVILSESGEKYTHIKQCTQAKTVKTVDFVQKYNGLKLKHLIDGFVSYMFLKMAWVNTFSANLTPPPQFFFK